MASSNKKKGGCGSFVFKIILVVIIVNVYISITDSKSKPTSYEPYETETTQSEYIDTTVPEPIPEQTQTTSADASAILSNFSSQYSYLAGTAGYTGYFVKQETQHVYSYAGSIPKQPITCLQMDFDLDGVEELLIVTVNEDDTTGLLMYEAINGAAQCVSTLYMPIPVAGSAENGLVDGIYYEQNGRIVISFYEMSSFGYLGDAQIIRFSAASYDGSQLYSLGFAETIGSAGMDPEFESMMASMELPVDLGALSRGDIGIRDYMTNPLTFSECATYCTWTMDDWIAYSDTWYNDPSVTSVQASIIEFR